MLRWLILIDRGFNHKYYLIYWVHIILVFRELFSLIFWIGNDSNEDTPVPISNTEVKLINGENSVKAKIASCQFFFLFLNYRNIVFFIWLTMLLLYVRFMLDDNMKRFCLICLVLPSAPLCKPAMSLPLDVGTISLC